MNVIRQQHFFEVFPKFKEKFSQASKPGKVFVYFDFDGTLAPIVSNPNDVQVSPEVTKNLVRIASSPYALVSVISGRELKFMRRHFTDENILLVGSHGSEMSYKDILTSRNEMLPTASRIHQKVMELRDNILTNGGAIIESKRFGVALHYRQCLLSGKKQIRKIAKEIVKYLPDTKVTILRGKQVAEINPKAGWTKGRAIEDIRKRFPTNKLLEIYIGDDISDESAFDALNLNDQYSIRVRKRKNSKARYFFNSQKEVELFLKKLASFQEFM